MELELKHLAVYLPYNVYAFDENQESKTDKIIGIFLNTLDFENWSPLNSDIKNYKLVLRPKSDISKLYSNIYEKFDIKLWKCDYEIEDLSFKVVEYLKSELIDIYDLIPNNLAVDINEIEK